MSKKIEAGIFLKELFEKYAKRLLTNKVRPSISEEGIMTIPNNQRVEKMAVSLYEDFKKAGVPDDILKTENDIKVFHHKIAEINNENIVKQFDTLMSESTLFNPKKSADVFDLKGNKIKNPDNIMGGEEIKKAVNKNKESEANILARLNKRNKEGIESLKNKSIIPKDEYVENSRNFDEEILGETYSFGFKKGKEFQLNASSMGKGSLKEIIDSGELVGDDLDFAISVLRDRKADGGRTEYYGGGQAMVGEDLSEIGHGSDSLMARNMQLAPNSMATTSTGLNYLLGQDNDTARVPYNKGKAVKEVADKGRRGFMKAAGAAGAGIAALKTGLLGFGEKVAPVAKEAVEAVSNTAGQVPPYFWKLVEKIKNLGDDAPRLAVKDREKVTTYKEYTLTEDVTTGEQTIERMKVTDPDSASYYGQPLTEETYMNYRPGKGLADETTKGKTPIDEYEEGTAYIRSDRMNAGEVVEESAGISDEIYEEVGEAIPEVIRKTKADGGRIGFNKGKFVKDQLIKAGEGKFTKAQYLIERIKNTIKGSPDDKYVQETFPNFIKELEANPDLAKNENVFKELGGDLPEGQQIVVYGDDTLDFFTTSSGPQNIQKLENFMAKHDLPKDQALRIMKMEPNDQVMELTKTKFLKQKRTDNSSGGLAAMLGE